MQILTILVSTPEGHVSLKNACLASSYCARVYLAHKELLSPLAFEAYLGPFIGPAIFLSQIETWLQAQQLPSDESAPEYPIDHLLSIAMARFYSSASMSFPCHEYIQSYRELLPAAVRTHTLLLAILILVRHRFATIPDIRPTYLPLSSLVHSLRLQVYNAYAFESQSALFPCIQDVVHAYIFHIRIGINCLRITNLPEQQVWVNLQDSMYENLGIVLSNQFSGLFDYYSAWCSQIVLSTVERARWYEEVSDRRECVRVICSGLSLAQQGEFLRTNDEIEARTWIRRKLQKNGVQVPEDNSLCGRITMSKDESGA